MFQGTNRLLDDRNALWEVVGAHVLYMLRRSSNAHMLPTDTTNNPTHPTHPTQL